MQELQCGAAVYCCRLTSWCAKTTQVAKQYDTRTKFMSCCKSRGTSVSHSQPGGHLVPGEARVCRRGRGQRRACPGGPPRCARQWPAQRHPRARSPAGSPAQAQLPAQTPAADIAPHMTTRHTSALLAANRQDSVWEPILGITQLTWSGTPCQSVYGDILCRI